MVRQDNSDDCSRGFEKYLDAIEREVEECYIELPKDADGEHIHMSDEMESVYEGRAFIVKRLKYSEKHGWMIGGACKDDLSEYNLYASKNYASKNCRHHKPPTVKDVLKEFALEVDPGADVDISGAEVIAKFAKRLQLNEEAE